MGDSAWGGTRALRDNHGYGTTGASVTALLWSALDAVLEVTLRSLTRLQEKARTETSGTQQVPFTVRWSEGFQDW
jgi:hypothetical protein